MSRKTDTQKGAVEKRTIPAFGKQLTLSNNVYCDWLQDGLEGLYTGMYIGLGKDVASELNVTVQDWDLEKEIVILIGLNGANNLIVNRATAKRQIAEWFNEKYLRFEANICNYTHLDGYVLNNFGMKQDAFVEFKFRKESDSKFAPWEVIELNHKLSKKQPKS